MASYRVEWKQSAKKELRKLRALRDAYADLDADLTVCGR